MAEEILNRLAMSDELTVIARTSSFALREEPIDAVMIGRRLNVAYLLEGSLRRSGEQLRLGVQLVDGRDGTRVWSASYDRALGDTLALQTEIARAVSDQLHVRFADSGERRRVDPVAYQRYMEARFRFNRRLGDDVLRAEQLYLEATRIDPDFARAWAGLAGVYWVRTGFEVNDSIRLSMPEALEAMALPIERALQADPDLAEAHVRAFLYYESTGEPGRARDHLARAQALAPNDPLVLASFAWNIDGLEPPQDQISLQRRIIAVDPLSLSPRNNLVHFLIQERRLSEARRELEETLSLFPTATGGFAYSLALIDLFEGDFEAAAAAAERLQGENDRLHEKTALLAMAWEGLGLTDRSVEARTRLESAPGEWAALRIAEIHAYNGVAEEAFVWLREASQRAAGDASHHILFWADVNDSPFLWGLKDDPRWQRLCDEAEALGSG
jgi:tetratricopeptide (TPR) repeat protein